MKRIMGLGVVFATVLVLALPFFGGGGPSFFVPAAAAAQAQTPVGATSTVVSTGASLQAAAALDAIMPIGPVVPPTMRTVPVSTDWEHVAQKPVPKPIPVTAAGAASGTAERRAARAAAGQS